MIAKAQEQKAIFESEVQDGEARLAQLKSLSEAQQEQLVGPSVVALQRRIDQLVQECEALKANPTRKELPGVWTDRAPPILEEVPPIPGDRQDQGSVKMATFAQDVPMHGQGTSSMMAALIDQVDAQRRCIEATVGWESGVRNSRYGLRGV